MFKNKSKKKRYYILLTRFGVNGTQRNKIFKNKN